MELSREEKLLKANKIYEQIKTKIEDKYKGKIIAIELESGDFFIGDSELEAFKKANKKYPNRDFVYKRIGFSVTHFVGNF